MIYNYRCSDDKILQLIVDNLFKYFEYLLRIYKSGTDKTSYYLVSIFGINNLLNKLVFEKDMFDNNYINSLAPYKKIIESIEDYCIVIQNC